VLDTWLLGFRLLREDPVGFWLGRVSPNSRNTYGHGLRFFLRWLGGKPGWTGIDGRRLLERQLEAKDPYVVLDLLQEFVSGLDRTLNAKLAIYTTVRSFFIHNRCVLPQDSAFRIRSSRPPPVSKLTLENVQDLVKAANLRDRSLILVKWQAVLDNERLIYVGKHLSDQVVSQIRKEIHPVRLDIPNRKENEKPYYTFISKDAREALIQYFDQERGWPKKGEPIWLEKGNAALSKTAFFWLWMALVRRIGLIPKKEGPAGSRYGFNPHEMRDIAKSLLHTEAKKDGFDMDCIEFWLGHTVDPLGYDKFYENQEYVKKQYLIAEKYLNIISTPPGAMNEKEQNQLRGLMQEMEELKQDLLEIREARHMEQRQHTLIGIDTAENSGV